MNAVSDPLLQAALDAALAAAQGMTRSPLPADASADAMSLASQRLALCVECAHYRDDDDGHPLDPPCALHVPWNRCRWKRAAASAAPDVKDGCLWAKAKEGENHA